MITHSITIFIDNIRIPHFTNWWSIFPRNEPGFLVLIVNDSMWSLLTLINDEQLFILEFEIQ